MESAEHRFFRSIGYSIVTSNLDPPIGWPRVHTSFDFKKPLRFEDEIEIHLLVAELRSKAITYQFRFNKLNGNDRELAATGKLTVVCVSRGATMANESLRHPGGDRVENRGRTGRVARILSRGQSAGHRVWRHANRGPVRTGGRSAARGVRPGQPPVTQRPPTRRSSPQDRQGD